ncbi:hydantoinase B/oxoprolinase family protein [Roseovarius sp.]|uniref:hydantoinase B/oxoprolinase family protein n=1 Tax=Roseovarius sp. TaxID=1486281 RepID=UPI003B5B179F
METTNLNGAELAILINRFEGIARKMTNTLYRTGRSGVLNRARDFSCCIVTADCQLLATADSLPIHVLVGPDMMAQAMKDFHPNLRRGDAFLHNSPYHGSSHAADHVLLIPVIDGTGKHRFTVLTKAHQADCGNAEPTTYMGTAQDVYAEGALIFPAVRVQENYRTIEDVARMCEMRIRVPDQWRGDFKAMIGSARIGEQEILRLGEEIGWDKLDAFCGQWFDYSEERMATRLSELPAGQASASSTHDPIPGTPDEGIRINATVTTKPEEGRVTIDLTDNIDALPCGLNLSEACSRSACLIALFNSIGGDIPRNAGSFRRVEMLLKENSVAGIPRHPTSCSVSTTNVADRVTHAVALSIAQLGEGFGTAEFGAFLPPSSAVVSGNDPRSGEPFVNQIFLGCTTGAGTPYEDAWLTYLHVGNGGMCFIDSVELDELYQPILVSERRILPNTEGAGRHIGAPSLRVEFGPLGCDIDVAYCSDGRLNPPRGVHGGGTGGGSNQFRRSADGKTEELQAAATVRIRQEESIVSVCCGGGGYGAPTQRDPLRVIKDVQDGWVTRDRALDVYGVVITENGDLDLDATQSERMRADA